MRRLVPAVLFLASCLELNPGGADAGATAAPAESSPSDAALAEAATGTNCAVDSVAGITLCTTISLCPGLAVAHDLYPDCGFRMAGGTVLDLECVCDSWLCPIGSALTCKDVAELLQSQSEQSVCTQLSEGRCAARGSPEARPSSGCDRQCESECGSSLGCVQACGC
jgi:hypothetical protein